MSPTWELHYDRRVSSSFLARFSPDGDAHLLADLARYAPYPVDLHFRRNPKTTGAEHASLYVGLTDVLKVRAAKNGHLRLDAHPTWSDTADKPKADRLGFDPEWRTGHAPPDWSKVEDYLERVLPAATRRHATQEGAVHAAVSKTPDEGWTVLDREAALHFRDQKIKSRLMADVTTPILDTLTGLAIPGQPKDKYGGECDLLALDERGRLLAVEIKPRNVGSIRWAAAQATVYSSLFRRWLHSTDVPENPVTILNGLWGQRADLKLTNPPKNGPLTTPPDVVPVVVLQRGTRPSLIDDFRRVQERLVLAGVGFPELQLFEAGMTGRLRRIEL